MKSGSGAAFAGVAVLFFAWGFLSANNDPLLLALKALYSLSWVEALLTHFMFAIAFGLVSIPAAALAARVGFGRTLPIALALSVAGCVLVAASAGHASYTIVLVGLFVTASGVVALQVAANPLATLLGPPERSHWRLNLAQSLNSFGVVIGANSGAAAMLAGDVGTDASGVRLSYGAMAAALTILAVALLALRRPLAGLGAATQDRQSVFAAFRSRWALFGAAALGLYVGAEVTLSSLLVAFLHQPTILGTSFSQGGALLANLYWGGALAGRLAGIVLLRRIAAPALLLGCAAGAIALCSLAVLASGPVAGFAALSIGLMNSIIFPTIFSITLERSGLPAPAVSGLLCAAIVGGALLPLAAGRIADLAGFAPALTLPVAAYAFVALFAQSAKAAD